MAKKLHPGQRNSLDALCKRYTIDNSHRELHGALLDAEILADVYLEMTGGQTALFLEGDPTTGSESVGGGIERLSSERPRLKVIRVTPEEEELHQKRLQAIDKASGGKCVWRQHDS